MGVLAKCDAVFGIVVAGLRKLVDVRRIDNRCSVNRCNSVATTKLYAVPIPAID